MKKLVIIGTGSHHVNLLQALTKQALEGVKVTLIAPSLRQLYGPMLAGFVAGRVTAPECLIDLEPQLKKSGIRYLPVGVSALNASAQTVTLTNGTSIGFDWLSLNSTDSPDRAQLELQLPGVREHGLFVQPSDAFAKLWPNVLALAQTRTLRLAVLGDNLQSVELAMAIRHQLPSASITLVMRSPALVQPPSVALSTELNASFQTRLAHALKQRRITVLDDHAVSLTRGQVMLGCGAALVCDVPLVALRTPAPSWLTNSALALDAQGFAATQNYRAIHHPSVFAADSATELQTVWRKRTTLDVFTQTLTDAIRGLPKHAAHKPELSALTLADAGSAALASWRNYSFEGRLLGRLKTALDHAALQRLRQA